MLFVMLSGCINDSNHNNLPPSPEIKVKSNLCGDGKCGTDENCSSCPVDCGGCMICGDGVCGGNETYETCLQDCPKPVLCGDGKCEGNE